MQCGECNRLKVAYAAATARSIELARAKIGNEEALSESYRSWEEARDALSSHLATHGAAEALTTQ